MPTPDRTSTLIRSFGWLALYLVAVIVVGVLGYMVLEGWNLVDATYMTTLTLTAVGFTEVHHLDAAGKVFTITLILLGVTGVVLALSMVARYLEEGGFGERGRRRRMERKIAGLSNHCIVCGFGRVGRTVTEELTRDGVPFLIIDKSEDREKELIDAGMLYLIGDATRREDLETAGIGRARAVISAVDDDAENIFITMVARAVAPEIWIVARASQEESVQRLETAGASRVFSPFVTAGREMAYSAINPRVVDFLEIEGTGAQAMRLEELHIDSDSRLAGLSVAEATGEANVLAVRRASGDVVASPGSDLILEPGDSVIVLGNRAALRLLER
ncbi:MAG TPA: potassium channel protein [Actinomycetota bacterium]|nr:potassium channel protein [Actinomycetota bacterium]